MKNVLIVIDMQNDFVKNEPFGNEAARAIIPEIQKMIESKFYDDIFFTRDCHYTWQKSIEMKDYPPHCLTNTEGWEIIDELKPYVDVAHTINKFSYGCNKWGSVLYDPIIENITLVGVCTDICVISNALMLRSIFPDVPIRVAEKACAGTSTRNHEMALETVLRPDFLFRKWYPVINAVTRGDTILSVEERKDKAVVLELRVRLPSVVREKELVAIIQPVRLNAKTNCEIDRKLHMIVGRYPISLDLLQVVFRWLQRDEHSAVVLEVGTEIAAVGKTFASFVVKLTNPVH